MTQRHPVQNDAPMLVTCVIKDRVPIFADPPRAREAVECLYRVQALHPFLLYAFVIMPDHLHVVLTVMSPATVAGIVGSYKSGLVFDLHRKSPWQPRYHMRVVRNLSAAVRYVHAHPVRAGLSEYPEDYPWSSACGKWDVTELDCFP